MTLPPDNTPVTVRYSDFGQSDRVTNGTQSYQNDQTGISAITDTVANTTTSYTRTPDGQLISERIPTGATGCPTGGPAVCAYYYLFDGLGSVVALTDSHGAVVNSYSYDPYGNATATETVPNPFRFTGAIWDASTGLYKMGERFYDPTIGRFTQPDPNGGGYTYCDDNPVNFVDPEGLKKHKPAKKKTRHHTTKHKSGSCGLFCSIGNAVGSAVRAVGGAVKAVGRAAYECASTGANEIVGSVALAAGAGAATGTLLASSAAAEGRTADAYPVVVFTTAAFVGSTLEADTYIAPFVCGVNFVRSLAG